MNIFKTEKKVAIISGLVEGNSIRSIERMTGVNRGTIKRLLVSVGDRFFKEARELEGGLCAAHRLVQLLPHPFDVAGNPGDGRWPCRQRMVNSKFIS